MSDALASCLGFQGVLEGSRGCFNFLGDLLCHCASHQSSDDVTDDDPSHATVRLLKCSQPAEPDGLENIIWNPSHQEKTCHFCQKC